jgi:hypothetical protein
MSREYGRLSDWSDGWMIMTTEGWDGNRGKEFGRSKMFNVIVPLGDALEFFSDPRELADKLEHSCRLLAEKYNAQTGRKRPQAWRKFISHKFWRNAKGKEEATIFEMILSTYNFHQTAVVSRAEQRHREGLPRGEDIDREAVIKISDIKVGAIICLFFFFSPTSER